jgi:pyruvate ferredoxin oxidoreductase gamma subunit
MGNEMIEIRWHGRGGQGAVTAAKTLAAASMREGKYFQAFPEYGPERRGAPLQAFTRLSDQPIRTFAQVKSPSIVVILDGSLIGRLPVADGLGEGGVVIANFDGTPEELRARLKWQNGRVFMVNAKRIATENLGSAITNMPMIGALVKATGVVSLETALEEVKESFAHKFRAEIVEANLKAMQEAYDETVEV